jgi:polysaccharide export outer membrane protein
MDRSRLLKLLLCALFSAAGAFGAVQDRRENPAPKNGETYPVYRIGAGDILQVDVWKEPDASVASVTVRPDGKISLVMIGEMDAAGLTPGELEGILAEKFGRVIRDARVTVTVREVTSQKVYVIGEVRREGPVRMAGPITVLQALAEAGGVTDYAKRNRIYILRMSSGRQVRLPFHYDEVVRGQNVEQNIRLYPGDTIVVPR